MTTRKEGQDTTPGRPAKNLSRAEQGEERARPKRISLSGFHRDILTVQGKDPAYYYRWIKDTNANGARIHAAIMAGYSFASPREHEVGETEVYTISETSSVIRRPAGKSHENEYLYLMRQPMEYHEEDRKSKNQFAQETIDSTRRAKFKGDPTTSNIDYGEVKVG